MRINEESYTTIRKICSIRDFCPIVNTIPFAPFKLPGRKVCMSLLNRNMVMAKKDEIEHKPEEQ